MSDLKINTKFAEKYEKYRQKEELQRLKDRYGDQDEENSSDSSDSDSDESEVELDPKLDRDFYRTLSLLKKKHPKIYQKDAKFFTEEASGSGSDDQPSTSKKSEKPMFLKDYERKVILERGGKYDDDDEDDSADEVVSRKMQKRAASPTYIQEQKELQESFRKFVQDSDDEDGGRQLLTRRTKTQEEKDKEEADYVEWLKGQAELEGEEGVRDMKYLRDYWNNPELDERESFLRDYVLNKGYLEEDEEDRIPTYNELMQEDVEDSEEEGESFLHKQEDFERHYNFRFEEPEAGKIKTYPRNIATSVRSKDDRRKMKRDEVKERKKKEKEQKQQQLKELKNLKRAEIMDKLKKLQELTGNEKLAFNDVDLEGDFEPQQHDQLMQKFFGDGYYGENEEEKPQFDDDDDLAENWNWDTWVGNEENEDEYGDEEDYASEEDYEPDCEDPDFIMDADFDPSQQPVSKKKRKKERQEKKKKTKEDAPLIGKKRKKSHFAEIITKNKPVFDPKEKTFEQYLDEYYKLDYEDIIDDLPCRFRYREVVPNDFGLTTDEILKADESELNRWCSLRKTCMYRSEREELCDVKNFQIKARNNKKKEQVFVSLYNENEGEEELKEPKGKVDKKRRDRLKRSEVNMEKRDLTEVASESAVVDGLGQTDPQELKEVAVQDEGEDDEEFLVPKKKMKWEETAVTPKEELAKERTDKPHWLKKKISRRGGRLLSRSMTVKMAGREFSRQRLQAYGLNPKRLHFRELYRQKRKEREKKEKLEKKSKQ
ncbi:protein KRI1 homolog [Sinocyclocheilus anshuiensis]|uniref:Protein KRI1 homolog n=1 Tax=Sinocyclocheilus anshuiensis TaxID=1608454 RepID=A0A671P9B1_9TELE|nr:PREDICTED: protein KRI1 homolog [Sinocyclocheilus anshuiensis]XP_016302840.1 PREDICTED: protein KRI1 homolog [Sinocyclocheilus anshuiensis]XP_016302841.1 PREDICTED: protein KRI1 homolog [Sinocyclocheilus anshuiensis]